MNLGLEGVNWFSGDAAVYQKLKQLSTREFSRDILSSGSANDYARLPVYVRKPCRYCSSSYLTIWCPGFLLSQDVHPISCILLVYIFILNAK